jgi:hypothetical protein
MLNTSNEYKLAVSDRENSPDFTDKATIILANGKTLEVTDADIVVNGLKINDATSGNNKFEVGAAIINKGILMLNNIENKFGNYDFTDAVIIPYVGLKLSNTTEWIKKGYFTVDEPMVASSIVNLACLDNMKKFDVPFSNVPIDFPCTAFNLLYAVCTYCGVSLATVNFINKDFLIQRRPPDEATICREIVSYVAQIAGCFARCNINGALELKWYDFGAFQALGNISGGIFDDNTPYVSGDSIDGGDFTFSETTNYDGGTFQQMKLYHHIFSLSAATIGTDDVVITGVRVKAKGIKEDYGETVLVGQEGYVIEMTNNPLIQENTAAVIANSVGAKILGMKFRPLTVTAVADPSIEAGDVAYISDRKGNTYQTLLTNLTYQIGKNETFTCDAETSSKKQSVYFDQSAKVSAEAREAARHEISSYDLAVRQLTNLMTYCFGIYKTEEKQPDGSAIYYMHNKPTLTESQTIWKMTADAFAVSTDGGKTWNAGFDSSGNVLLNVLSAIGINADWIRVLTYFAVGDCFSVDSQGHLKAVDANLSGSITADTGRIAGMEITSNSLRRTYEVDTGNGLKSYTTELGFRGDFFSISTENEDNTCSGGMNVSHGNDGTPEMNIYVRDDNGLRDDKILINGQSVIETTNATYNQLWHLINFCMQRFGYDPTS